MKEDSLEKILEEQEKAKGSTCRICLGEEDLQEKDGQLIAPCKCSGTMKYIHLSCLKNWLDQKKQVREGDHFTSFMWEGLECELCKTSFESIFVKVGNQTIDLLGIELPKDSHFLFLESVNTEEILKKT